MTGVLDQRAGHAIRWRWPPESLRQPVLADRRVIAEREAHDELMRASRLRSLDDLVLRRAFLAKAMLARMVSRNR